MNRDKNPWVQTFSVPVLLFGLVSLLSACDPINGDDDDDSNGGGGSGGSTFNRIVGSAQSGTANGAHNVARFNNPVNVEVASDGRVYVADFDNGAIRVISTTGAVTTLANDATVTGTFARPFGLTIAPDTLLYVQTDTNDSGVNDTTTGTIWRIDRGSGMATVLARNLGRPRGLQALANGSLAMSDPANHVITLLSSAGAETLLAGSGTAGFADGTGAAAQFNRPYGLALLPDGSLLVADQGNNRLRQVTVPGGVVTTFAGTGTAGNANGPVASATFRAPQDVAADGANIYVADHDNFVIRRITGGNVTTLAGDGTQGFNDGVGTQASFVGLEGIALNAAGSLLWIADGDNGDTTNCSSSSPPAVCSNRVRRLNVP